MGAEAALTVGATTNLTSTGTNFSNYTGTTSLTYFIRTTQSGGSGFIKLEVTTDFAPAGGPSVATPPTAGDALNYTCTVANPGNNGTATACTSPTTSSTTAQTNVATFGTDNRSLIGGNSASVRLDLDQRPQVQDRGLFGNCNLYDQCKLKSSKSAQADKFKNIRRHTR